MKFDGVLFLLAGGAGCGARDRDRESNIALIILADIGSTVSAAGNGFF